MRSIRLKEFDPGSSRRLAPADKYRALSDDTLPAGPFLRRGTADGFLATGNNRGTATQNLVLLGGSFVESVYCAEEKRFPSVLERALPPDWRVLNGGYSGMTTLHMLPIVATKIPPLMTPGSRLVLFIGQSDLTALQDSGRYWSTQERISPILPPPAGGTVGWGQEEALERTVDALLATVHAFGFKAGVVTSPFRDSDPETDPVLRTLYQGSADRYEQATQIRRAIQDAGERAAARYEMPFLDGQQLVVPTDFYDSMHLNPAGQQTFAEGMLSWLDSW